jgi:urea transport system permease protein
MLTQYVSPTALELSFSISCVVWAAVGGRLSLLGAAIGAYLINGMQSYFGDEFQQLWLIILGVLFIGVVLLLPKGLIGLLEILLGKFSGGNERSSSTSKKDSEGV